MWADMTDVTPGRDRAPKRHQLHRVEPGPVRVADRERDV